MNSRPTQTRNTTLSRKLLHASLRLPAVLVPGVLALVLTTITSTAMADPRFKNNGPRFNSSFNSSFSSHYNASNRRSVNRHSGWNRNWSRNSGWNNQFNDIRYNNVRFNNVRYNDSRFYDNRYRYRNNGRDNWSVNLNFGTGLSSWYNSGIYTGFSSGYYPRRSTTVIYNQPQVVYVNKSSQVSGHGNGTIVSSRSTSRAASATC